MDFISNQSGSIVNGAVSGLAAAIQAGVPLAVLLPCLPPSVGLKTLLNGKEIRTGHGKAPAHPGLNGEWFGLKNWERGGIAKDVLRASYEQSANAGMLMGVPCGKCQYIGIDIDLNDDPRAVEWRDHFISRFTTWFRQPVLVRETVPHRALLLAALPSKEFPGTKKIFHLAFKPADAELEVPAGKIEILTAGQQCIVAGTHPSGNSIKWFWANKPEDKLPGPDLSGPVPNFDSFDELLGRVRDLVDFMGLSGFSFAESGRTANSVAPGLADLAAPSVDKLVTLVNAMPNPASVDRDTYTAVMFAISGARAGLFAKTRSLDMVDDDRIGRAAAEWAARWPGTNGHTAGSVEDELAKWNADWVKPQTQNYAGWDQLLRHAHNFGTGNAVLAPLAMEQAQNAFQAEMLPAGMAAQGVSDQRVMLQVNGSDEGAVAQQLGEILGKSPNLFDHDGPVRLIPGDGQSLPKIKPLTTAAARCEAYRCCRPFVVSNGQTKPAKLSKDLADLAMAEPDKWGLRPLAGITTAPILRAGGEICAINGYDPETRLWCEGIPALDVPDRPTYEDARTALAVLRHRFRTFAFADAIVLSDPELGVNVVDQNAKPGMDESAFLVGLLTAVCRSSLDLAPGFLVRGPKLSGSGAGKGLLVRAMCAIAFGWQPKSQAHPGDVSEFENRLDSILIEGGPAIFFDNLNDLTLKSNALALVLTERPAGVRIFGKKEIRNIDCASWFAITGNGTSAAEDLIRRILNCEFDAKMERPAERRFKEDFRESIKQHRAALLAACLTVWRWGQHGCPGVVDAKPGLALGSYERWAKWCRDPLLALGCQDPVIRIGEAYAIDPIRLETIHQFQLWHQHHKDEWVSPAKVHPEVARAIMAGKADFKSWQSLVPHLKHLGGTREGGAWLQIRESKRPEYRLQITDQEKWQQACEDNKESLTDLV